MHASACTQMHMFEYTYTQTHTYIHPHTHHNTHTVTRLNNLSSDKSKKNYGIVGQIICLVKNCLSNVHHCVSMSVCLQLFENTFNIKKKLYKSSQKMGFTCCLQLSARPTNAGRLICIRSACTSNGRGSVVKLWGVVILVVVC